jgi:hypothetical protein
VDSAEQYLDQLQQEGALHSTGRITISAEKLREKLSQFSFYRPSYWILKVIQALTLAQVQSCTIVQSHQRTEIHIKSQASIFGTEQLELAFYDPDSQPHSSIGNFTIALWYLSFSLQLRWAWKDQNSQTGLVWNGNELTKIDSSATDYATLHVNHVQPKVEGAWWAPLLKIARYKGPEACAQISRELSLRAFTCPFPLKLDGLRIDNLLRCPTMANSANTSTTATELIALPGYGSTPGPAAPLIISHRASTIYHPQENPDHQIPPGNTWLALLFGHLRPVIHSYGPDYAPSPNTSRISWIRNGVIVLEDKLPTTGGASIQLFLSADHLKTDISGLKLIQEPTAPRPEIIQAIIDWLRPENYQLTLQNRFASLGVDAPELLENILRKEITGLIGQLRHISAAKEESITNLSQLLKQIQTDLKIEPG